MSSPSGTAVALTDALTRLRRALRSSIRTDIAWETLPMAQVELLQTLADGSRTRVGDLAEHLHLAPSTVSGLISQMLTSGLVQRDTDPDDRRAAVVVLTVEGKKQLAAWEAANERRVADALSRLSREDRAAIAAALPGLRALAAELR
jgi:DNA-binding MarR family transcriptional regulator